MLLPSVLFPHLVPFFCLENTEGTAQDVIIDSLYQVVVWCCVILLATPLMLLLVLFLLGWLHWTNLFLLLLYLLNVGRRWEEMK